MEKSSLWCSSHWFPLMLNVRQNWQLDRVKLTLRPWRSFNSRSANSSPLATLSSILILTIPSQDLELQCGWTSFIPDSHVADGWLRHRSGHCLGHCPNHCLGHCLGHCPGHCLRHCLGHRIGCRVKYEVRLTCEWAMRRCRADWRGSELRQWGLILAENWQVTVLSIVSMYLVYRAPVSAAYSPSTSPSVYGTDWPTNDIEWHHHVTTQTVVEIIIIITLITISDQQKEFHLFDVFWVFTIDGVVCGDTPHVSLSHHLMYIYAVKS